MSNRLREQHTLPRIQAFPSTPHGALERGMKDLTGVEEGSRIIETRKKCRSRLIKAYTPLQIEKPPKPTGQNVKLPNSV